MSSAERKRRIAITGVGLFSPIGIGRDAFIENLEAGRTGIRRTVDFEHPATPGGLGGIVEEFSEDTAKKIYPKNQRKSVKMMCREIQLGAAAAMQAVEDSQLDLSSINHERFGVEYGSNLMFFSPDSMADSCGACRNESGEFEFSKWGSVGLGSMEPLWMLRYLPNMPACHIAIFTDARGPNNSVTLDEASPGVALTEALNIMERGAADVMLVGGTGTRVHPVRAVHARLYDELGFDAEHPEQSCRPFDARRTGQVLAEASACLVLEEESHARARGANILGYLLGGGSSCVASPSGEPNPQQAILNATRSALRRANLDAASLGHINAHGIATKVGDQAEAAAIRELLGSAAGDVPVTGLKGYFGNSGAATGFLEIVGSLFELQKSRIPRSLNCGEPDQELGLDLVGEATRDSSKKSFLKINYTRAGQASAVVIEAE